MFNTKKKISIFYGITFLTLFIISVIWTICIATIDPDITVSYLFHKNIILNLLIYLFYTLYKELGIFAPTILFAIFLFCLLFPIIYSIKKRKVFPYNLIFIIFFGVYFFYNFLSFIFFGDITEWIKKDYAKIEGIEFYWHEGGKNDYSFSDSSSNTIHVVSYWKHSLNDDDKVALVNGKKIIDAINKFYNETKMYPDTLEQLVPKYLEEVPETEYPGLWTSNSFYYSKNNDNRWYNLKFCGFFEDWYWDNDKKLWEFEED